MSTETSSLLSRAPTAADGRPPVRKTVWTAGAVALCLSGLAGISVHRGGAAPRTTATAASATTAALDTAPDENKATFVTSPDGATHPVGSDLVAAAGADASQTGKVTWAASEPVKIAEWWLEHLPTSSWMVGNFSDVDGGCATYGKVFVGNERLGMMWRIRTGSLN